jgi:putative spermidine/putrescine transport system permease protein
MDRFLMTVGKAAYIALIGLTVVYLLFPLLVMLPISINEINDLRFPPVGFSLRWYAAFFNDPVWVSAFFNSVKVATGTVIVSVTLGTLAAVGLDGAAPRLRSALQGYLLVPIFSPVIVLAIGIFMVFSRWGIAGTLSGLVLAHSILATPLVVVAVSTALQTMPPNLAQAASGLGASRPLVFFRVKLPLLKSGIFSGAVFAFITSWDEAVISTFLSSPATKTLPVLIWGGVQTGLTPIIAAVGSVMVLLTAFAFVIVWFVRTRKATDQDKHL